MSKRAGQKSIYQFTTHLAVVVMLLIMFVCAAYFFYLPPPEPAGSRDETLAELARNRDTWKARRPRSYRYVVDRKCSCPRALDAPYVVTEKGSDRDARFNVPIESDGGELLDAPPDAVWLDDLFTLVERSVSANDTVRVEYDASYGFPELVDIDRNDRGTNSVDSYEIRDFVVLEYE